ncbi:MAG: S10 family peptidase [Bacteroidales bacterium]
MKSTRFVLALAIVSTLMLVPTPTALGQGGAGRQSAPPPVAAGARAGTEAALLPAEPVVSQHTGKFNGQTVSYTAEVGWLPIRDDGKVVAKMGYFAYTKNGVTDVSKRPLLISFNGGPGTASVWMHLGYTGPRRVKYDDEGFQQLPPAGLEDNPYSILDIADIVYLDPIGTGFSRMVEGEDPHKFHGKLADIQSVGDFIYAFVNKKDRWASPKFIIGESYGTTRASGLAASVQSRFQMYLNGVILVSATELDVDRGPEIDFATSLPTKTATAWYHKHLVPDLQAKPLRTVLAEAEAFAMGEYITALVKGDHLPDAERDAIATKLARYTGLSKEYVVQANLRISFDRHWKELLRDRRLTVGRLDTRYLGIDKDAAGERPEYSPEMADWNGPFGAAINTYVRSELKYNPEVQYYIWGNVRPWAQDAQASVGDMLRTAMRDNPYLKVLVQGGYYDAACDYFNATYTMQHLQPGGEFKDRYRFAWYESGHMMYLRRADLRNANDDLRKFITWALEGVKDYPRKTN